MGEEKQIEHHWHDPSQGQVVKAMYQYLADQGVTAASIEKVIASKIDEALTKWVNRVCTGPRLEELLMAAVMAYVRNEKEVFDRTGGYSLTNRIRDIIQKELAALLTKDYEVVVRKREGAK